MRYGPSPCNGRLTSTSAMPALQSGHWSVSAPTSTAIAPSRTATVAASGRAIVLRWCGAAAGTSSCGSCCVMRRRASRTQKIAPRHSQTSGSAAQTPPSSTGPRHGGRRLACAFERLGELVVDARQRRGGGRSPRASSARAVDRVAETVEIGGLEPCGLRGDALELGQRRRDSRSRSPRAPLRSPSAPPGEPSASTAGESIAPATLGHHGRGQGHGPRARRRAVASASVSRQPGAGRLSRGGGGVARAGPRRAGRGARRPRAPRRACREGARARPRGGAARTRAAGGRDRAVGHERGDARDARHGRRGARQAVRPRRAARDGAAGARGRPRVRIPGTRGSHA